GAHRAADDGAVVHPLPAHVGHRDAWAHRPLGEDGERSGPHRLGGRHGVSEPTVVLGTGAPARVRRSRLIDRGFRVTTLVVGLGLIALLALMLVELTSGAWRTFDAFGFHFFVGTQWNPVSGREDFGALPFI